MSRVQIQEPEESEEMVRDSSPERGFNNNQASFGGEGVPDTAGEPRMLTKAALISNGHNNERS